MVVTQPFFCDKTLSRESAGSGKIQSVGLLTYAVQSMLCQECPPSRGDPQ